MPKRYYVYRWNDLGCNEENAKFLGVFETPYPVMLVWDLMFQIFCEDGGGMFVRESLI